MGSVSIENGIVLGFGGTNARFAECHLGDIQGFDTISTPEKPREFFSWMARQVLRSADSGAHWMVAGFPGPVSEDGSHVGPMHNVSGLSQSSYNLTEQLAAADAAAGRLLDEGFRLIAVNDGELAAQAAAFRIGELRYDTTAALIIGTGVGAGIVNRDHDLQDVYRTDRNNPSEIGHVMIGTDPHDTFENAISGPALTRTYGTKAKDLPANHPAWRKVGETTGRLATMIGLMNGADLVVPCGGVGAGASDFYEPHLRNMMTVYKNYVNATQKKFTPEILPVPSAEAQVFEMYGAEGVMRDFMTRD